MKRLLFTLLALVVLASSAFATDITINSALLPNFNTPVASGDQGLTLNVTNGSSAVTCAFGLNCLPSNMVGIPGATIDIAGVRYAIANAQSVTSFVLTTTYSGSTNNAASATLWRWVKLQIYANSSFVPNGSAYAVQSGIVGSGAFFKRVACGVTNDGSGNVLNIPQLILPATLDASPSSATWNANFFDQSGSQLIGTFNGLSAFSLAASPTTTSWTTIYGLNNPAPSFSLPGTGLFAQTGALTFALRNIVATGNQIVVTNPDGSTGNPTLSFTPKGLVRNIQVDTSVVNSVGAGPDTLHTFTLLAGSLANDLDMLRVVYTGSFAANTNLKRLQVLFDTQIIYDSGAFDVRGGDWKINMDIIRTSVTSIRASAGIMENQVTVAGNSTAVGAGNGTVIGARNVNPTVSNLTTNAVVIKVVAFATSAADLVQNYSTLDLIQR